MDDDDGNAWIDPSPIIEKVVRDVAEHGWEGISVFQAFMPGHPDFSPAFTYTIGFAKTLGHAELIATGLDPTTAHGVFWDIFNRVKESGRPMLPWAETLGLLRDNYPVTFLPVGDEIKDEWMRGASAYYGGPSEFPAYQMIYPDKGFVWPWEEGFNQAILPVVPVLGEL